MAKKDTAVAKRKPTFPNEFELPEGDNNKFTTFALRMLEMPKIDIRNYEQVQTRILEYFQLCATMDIKPGVAGLAQALGTDRRRLWEMNNGIANKTIPREVHELVKTTYNSLETLMETYTQAGKINPVSAIFLMKNNFGYADKQEYVLTPNTTTEADPNVIVAKYDELPE